MNLVDKDDILKDIDDLQKSPWYNDGVDVESGRRLQYNIRKEAVEIVRDICIKVAPIVDAIPVEWLRQKQDEAYKAVYYCGGNVERNAEIMSAIRTVLELWEKEQGAR